MFAQNKPPSMLLIKMKRTKKELLSVLLCFNKKSLKSLISQRNNRKFVSFHNPPDLENLLVVVSANKGSTSKSRVILTTDL